MSSEIPLCKRCIPFACRSVGERAAVGESRGFSGIEPCGPALRPEHIGRMRAKWQADGCAYAAKIFFPSPSDPGMLPPMKHRSVRDAAFPGRCRARHGRTAEAKETRRDML